MTSSQSSSMIFSGPIHLETPPSLEYLMLLTQYKKIVEAQFQKRDQFNIVGNTSSLALAQVLTNFNQSLSQEAHLIVTPNLDVAQKFITHCLFFEQQCTPYLLPCFDVSPYSGLYPKTDIARERTYWLSHALNAKAGEIFVAPIQALLQKTISQDVFFENAFQLQKGHELPESFKKKLDSLGYTSTSLVEVPGHFALRGGILDIFTPHYKAPVRIELFGDTIESIKFFNPETQRSLNPVDQVTIISPHEVLFDDEDIENVIKRFRELNSHSDVDEAEVNTIVHSLIHRQFFPGIEFLVSTFYPHASSPIDFLSSKTNIWLLDDIEVTRMADQFLAKLQSEYETSISQAIRPNIGSLFLSFEKLNLKNFNKLISISNIEINQFEEDSTSQAFYKTFQVKDFSQLLINNSFGSEKWIHHAQEKIQDWIDQNYTLFIVSKTKTQEQRIIISLEKMGFPIHRIPIEEMERAHFSYQPGEIHLMTGEIYESLGLKDDKIIFLRSTDFLGEKKSSSIAKKKNSAQHQYLSEVQKLNFSDLKPGDYIVHIDHGIGLYEGLKIMPIPYKETQVDAEFIQIKYKDNDRLYLPVYRVGQLQKYSGGQVSHSLDKLGGNSWEKTKTRVKSKIKDIASELLTLYAKRSQLKRHPLQNFENYLPNFEDEFPYEETGDQLSALNDIFKDFTSEKPMDRLICGDVGFGKTEVAMRAAFCMIKEGKKVAVLAPTTVLTFQHFETFKKRFSSWPVEIRVLNRFVSTTEQKKIIKDLSEGKVDIIIGTHRLLSKDISYSNLGLLIIDEEQKFGVTHKEKMKKLSQDIDTLTLSATPIPRTLNMSLVGIRDLSLINTPPQDRVPTRTFICKFNAEVIRKGIEAEVKRGGQVFFIHNRVQSIYGLADELRSILPQVRMKVAHGQMQENELEKVMLSFFNHEIDVLICTTIVESGMDISNANTMFIDNAHMFGLSQLYQLRGRVGRSKQRAYCYLMVPRKELDKEAQERLKVLQENTALGSGIRIAHYDLELRGAGNILGPEQSGHVNAVGYELYMDLLDEALKSARGEPLEKEIEPEINLRIPAMIPSEYIDDIRLRLFYYKALASIQSEDDIDKIEDELRDQFGKIPEPVYNLFGIMIIRLYCKKLRIIDLSAGLKNISLAFSNDTPLSPEKAIKLTMRTDKKFSITPKSYLLVRMNGVTWQKVYDELVYLLKYSS